MHRSFWDCVCWRWGERGDGVGGVCRYVRDREWEGGGEGETVKEKQKAGGDISEKRVGKVRVCGVC